MFYAIHADTLLSADQANFQCNLVNVKANHEVTKALNKCTVFQCGC